MCVGRIVRWKCPPVRDGWSESAEKSERVA